MTTHLVARWRMVFFASALAAIVRCGHSLPAERTFPAVLAAVEEAADITVTSGAWEPSAGPLTDLTLGRPLLITGSSTPNGPQDVLRAFVRVAPDGAPLTVRRVYNLTDTPHADERALLVRGPLAAFATVAFNHVQSLTVLDSRGVYLADSQAGWLNGALHRMELRLTSLLETGTLRGVGRTDVEFADPPNELEFELRPDRLTVTSDAARWHLESRERGLELVTAKEQPSGQPSAPPEDGEIAVLPRLAQPKPTLHWLADTGRSLVGSGPIAWLEGRAFSLLDRSRRWSYGLIRRNEEAVANGTTLPPRRLESGQAVDAGEGEWPPPPIPSLWKSPQPEEGQWKPVELPFLRRLPDTDSAPPYFFRTFVRPDRERPYADVLLVAMDMRRLELGMEGGYEDPRPTAGAPGTGHVPKDPQTYRRIVATFNGAFKTTHGNHGMVVNRRVLVPPRPGAATVRVDRDGRVGMGTWPPAPADEQDENDLNLPSNLVSLRQNLDALIEGDSINPRGRDVWGSQLYGQGVAAERSALCVTRAGHLIYAWGEETSGETLGQALQMAGCDYGLHLDMNPGHCAFIFMDILDFEKVEARTQVLDQRMRVNPKRYIRWSPKDFFYVTLRDPLPSGSELTWSVDEGTQAPPSWLPSILRATKQIGSLSVEVLRFESNRIRWTARPGSAEPGTAANGSDQTPPELGHVLATIGLGHSTGAVRRGLAFGQTQRVALDPALGTLVLSDAAPRIDPPGTPLQPQDGQILVQLPLLAQDGDLVPRARRLGPLRERAALCLDEHNHLLLARIIHDSSAPAAQALLQLGCGLVVEADRGSQHPPFVERAGTDKPPQIGHEATVLYGTGHAMPPRAYWWRPQDTDAPSSR